MKGLGQSSSQEAGAGAPASDPGSERPAWTVLVPAYNEAANLASTVATVRTVLDRLGVTHEVLIVDDGSVDGTGQIAEQLAAHDPQVRVAHHATNQGIGAGFASGLRLARGRRLILVPADLAIEPDDLAKYAAASHQADIVVGVSGHRPDYGRLRRAVSRLNVWLIQRLFGLPFRQFNYISLYDVDLLRRVGVRYWHSAFFYAEVLVRSRDLGARLTEVEVGYRPRASGRATGARAGLVLRTGWDMLHFWFLRHLGFRTVAAASSEKRPCPRHENG